MCRVTRSGEVTTLKCNVHSCHVCEQLQTPAMRLNVSFDLTASFLCTESVRCRESGGAKVECFCRISTMTEALVEAGFSNKHVPVSVIKMLQQNSSSM